MRKLVVTPNEPGTHPDRFEFYAVGRVVLKRIDNLTLQLEVDEAIVTIQGCAGTNSWMQLVRAEIGKAEGEE